MSEVTVSVVIPTHNRAESIATTLEVLGRQDLPPDDYEIIVVDDGSTPPVRLNAKSKGPACSLVRLEGVERSLARNHGAAVAAGDILLFLDDDMTVGFDFLNAHLRAHEEWPEALVVGSVRLPDEALATPFGRFRQDLEQRGTPRLRGLASARNFCTAANMSISRELFLRLGGFDASVFSGEDQDLALRHTARGGQIAFIPEALAIHHDQSVDVKSYCRRAEWGSEHMVAFCQRYADWPDNIERRRINGPVRWKHEPVTQIARKLIKAALALGPVVAAMSISASLLERVAPQSRALNRVYRLLLGSHIFRGYRRGHRATFIDQQTGIRAIKQRLLD
ncbi:MAG TPA: glycosyltransferase family 2 protein [Blastocatellia bacterium]|nr:glycosyltransferase family 2 protein [Blastocatellia bacterium]